VDVTEYLDLLFKAVDSPAVSYAIHTMSQSALPHARQTILLLDTLSAEQRARLTAEEVLAPLDMLFEFGELHCAEPPDPALRPVLLLGPGTSLIGTPRHLLPRGTLQNKVESLYNYYKSFKLLFIYHIYTHT